MNISDRVHAVQPSPHRQYLAATFWDLRYPFRLAELSGAQEDARDRDGHESLAQQFGWETNQAEPPLRAHL